MSIGCHHNSCFMCIFYIINANSVL
ncbi:hypothetical protein DMS68_03625 [Klebsiella variicola]|nr:hypothetical protein [Klebsiella variicola]HBZ7249824.1 hypothetical protein [Klebsiella variicola subsp. variicola]PXL76748.1 hypothetical protein DMS68_03625 [Klebsiella variicola]HCC2353622.1 hypothetical protein [Klebsiella variicola]HCM8072625.1 hypothetical protein [Klebsiella variicola]